MSKKGVSKIAGNLAPEVGTAYEYTVEEWYPATPLQLRDPSRVTWELFKKRPDGKFTSTGIRKKGSGTFIFGEVSSKHTYRLEAYLYHPEGSGPTTLEIRPQPAARPKITKVELLHIDSSPGNRFSFTDRLIAQAHSVNLVGKKILFTLWEDDAAGSGHQASNLIIDRKEALIQRDGTAAVSFMLSKALVKKALHGEHDPRALEFYVTAEYYTHQKQASCNVDVENPLIFEIPRKTPPLQPATVETAKANGSPASGKPASKKEEKGLLEKFSDGLKELWDWQETRGTIEKDRKPVVQRKEGKSVSIVEGHENNICFCEANNLYWGKYFSCQERKKIIEIANRLGCKPDYLTSAMALETKGTFNPALINEWGYTGLVQIGLDAAKDINRRKGVNISAGKNGNLKDMTKFEQLIYVEYYLEPFKGKLNTLADLYLAILMPVDCGKGNQVSHVVFDKNLILDYNSKGKVIKNTKWVRKKAYLTNPVFHKEKKEDGKTYVWEIAEEIEKWYIKGEANKELTFSCQKRKADKKDTKASEKWHDPVDDPQLCLYTQNGNYRPRYNVFGKVRKERKNIIHQGVDFLALPGSNVYACVDSTIVFIEEQKGYGNVICLKVKDRDAFLKRKRNFKLLYSTEGEILEGKGFNYEKDFYLFYAHLQKINISINDREVKSGDIIAFNGTSGYSSTKDPHLHFEIRNKSKSAGLNNRCHPGIFVYYKGENDMSQTEKDHQKNIARKNWD
jgi:murein DD-endopeptidase MepM/ murein hydrolase activator NlpD